MNFAQNTPVETTLGEQLLLLSLDDESGTEKESMNVSYAIAAASLVELALAGRVEVHDDQVTVHDAAPLGIPPWTRRWPRSPVTRGASRARPRSGSST